MPSDAPSGETALPFVRMVLAANDRDNALWPPENTQFAQKILIKTRGRVTALEEIIDALGEEKFQSLRSTIVEKRRFDNLCLGYQNPCHYCGGFDDLKRFDFGLMQVTKTHRNWGGTAASLALSAALIPLTGGGALRLPGKSQQGPALHLRLIVCAPCRRQEGGMFGTFFLTAKKAAKHPLWTQLITAGFTTFLARETLPIEFKTLAQTRL